MERLYGYKFFFKFMNSEISWVVCSCGSKSIEEYLNQAFSEIRQDIDIDECFEYMNKFEEVYNVIIRKNNGGK